MTVERGGATTGDVHGGTTTIEVEVAADAPLRAPVEPVTTVEWVCRDGDGPEAVGASFHDRAESWDVSDGSLEASRSGEGKSRVALLPTTRTDRGVGRHAGRPAVHEPRRITGGPVPGDGGRLTQAGQGSLFAVDRGPVSQL